MDVAGDLEKNSFRGEVGSPEWNGLQGEWMERMHSQWGELCLEELWSQRNKNSILVGGEMRSRQDYFSLSFSRWKKIINVFVCWWEGPSGEGENWWCGRKEMLGHARVRSLTRQEWIGYSTQVAGLVSPKNIDHNITAIGEWIKYMNIATGRWVEAVVNVLFASIYQWSRKQGH